MKRQNSFLQGTWGTFLLPGFGWRAGSTYIFGEFIFAGNGKFPFSTCSFRCLLFQHVCCCHCFYDVYHASSDKRRESAISSGEARRNATECFAILWSAAVSHDTFALPDDHMIGCLAQSPCALGTSVSARAWVNHVIFICPMTQRLRHSCGTISIPWRRFWISRGRQLFRNHATIFATPHQNLTSALAENVVCVVLC